MVRRVIHEIWKVRRNREIAIFQRAVPELDVDVFPVLRRFVELSKKALVTVTRPSKWSVVIVYLSGCSRYGARTAGLKKPRIRRALLSIDTADCIECAFPNRSRFAARHTDDEDADLRFRKPGGERSECRQMSWWPARQVRRGCPRGRLVRHASALTSYSTSSSLNFATSRSVEG